MVDGREVERNRRREHERTASQGFINWTGRREETQQSWNRSSGAVPVVCIGIQ
jgi:hypothetical protein